MKHGLLLCAVGIAVALAAGGCRSTGNARLGDPGAVGPLVGLAMGLTGAAASRATGGCYAACPVGTTCNQATGMCDELPCRGQCGEGEECVKAGLTQKCVALGLPGSGFVVQPPASATKSAPPPEGRTDVPADERDAPASDAPVRQAAPPPP